MPPASPSCESGVVQSDETGRTPDRNKSSGGSGSSLAIGLAVGLALSVAADNYAFLAIGLALGVAMGAFDDKDKTD